jgi:hypothetical protein
MIQMYAPLLNSQIRKTPESSVPWLGLESSFDCRPPLIHLQRNWNVNNFFRVI